jgi:hypothetical protein
MPNGIYDQEIFDFDIRVLDIFLSHPNMTWNEAQRLAVDKIKEEKRIAAERGSK